MRSGVGFVGVSARIRSVMGLPDASSSIILMPVPPMSTVRVMTDWLRRVGALGGVGLEAVFFISNTFYMAMGRMGLAR